MEVLCSFRPERVLFRPGGVNLRDCLCGVPMYASAQSLDFLARTKNPSFPNRKPTVSHPEFPDGNYVIQWLPFLPERQLFLWELSWKKHNFLLLRKKDNNSPFFCLSVSRCLCCHSCRFTLYSPMLLPSITRVMLVKYLILVIFW